ncbi:MAG: tRNA guanosine(34) transglycosylase Tgt [Anaerolineae bacterium]|nr:tRNA guanosine(34) transglycosylase Tgt [Thermoflexus sp.]MDW8064379.1 tRNA guanosine(34) transglycosylase Tgt [Anaerolineae bacterium]
MEGEGFRFILAARDGQARAGFIDTPHGRIPTPCFAPVGTYGAVKTIPVWDLEALGAPLILANAYHLYLRPGDQRIASMGGLHRFMGWNRPILTDSGGFQIFSLQGLREVDDDGVIFRSHLDGSLHRFTPEKAIRIQENLGADLIMCLDECAPPMDYDYNVKALERTHRWAERCRAAHTRRDQALFGIVQGGIFEDLRAQSARFLTGLDFPGYAIGGLSVGEPRGMTHRVLELMDALLPEQKPRYLMGVGTLVDLVEAVARGVDLFDCVMPTRVARHGTALTRTGRLNLRNAAYAEDLRPIDEQCECPTCRRFSRAYLRHLFNVGEPLAMHLTTLHNLHTMFRFMEEMRQAIVEGRFADFRAAAAENHASLAIKREPGTET